MKQSAIFLDRDGTLIEDRGYLKDPESIEWLSGAVDALKLLQPHFQFFIVTNQPAVSMEIITLEDVNRVNEILRSDLSCAGISIKDIYVCPHRREDGCSCIKPKSHFLQVAAERHHLNLSRSFVIGDHPHDVELARNAGACGIYVLTGHGRRHLNSVATGSIIVSDLKEAAQWILTVGFIGSRC